jgi:hypothetical protein
MSPFAMINKIKGLNHTEEQILKAQTEAKDFFDLTNAGCFESIPFYGQYPITRACDEVDAVLSGYGIPYGPWQKSESADWQGRVVSRLCNGVVLFEWVG